MVLPRASPTVLCQLGTSMLGQGGDTISSTLSQGHAAALLHQQWDAATVLLALPAQSAQPESRQDCAGGCPVEEDAGCPTASPRRQGVKQSPTDSAAHGYLPSGPPIALQQVPSQPSCEQGFTGTLHWHHPAKPAHPPPCLPHSSCKQQGGKEHPELRQCRPINSCCGIQHQPPPSPGSRTWQHLHRRGVPCPPRMLCPSTGAAAAGPCQQGKPPPVPHIFQPFLFWRHRDPPSSTPSSQGGKGRPVRTTPLQGGSFPALGQGAEGTNPAKGEAATLLPGSPPPHTHPLPTPGLRAPLTRCDTEAASGASTPHHSSETSEPPTLAQGQTKPGSALPSLALQRREFQLRSPSCPKHMDTEAQGRQTP